MSFLRGLFGGKENKKPEPPKDEDIVLQYLQKGVSKDNIRSEIINHELVLQDFKMSIKAGIANKTQHPNALVIQIDFIIEQESFDIGIHESLAGIGKGNDIKDAIKNGVTVFVENVLTAVIQSFYESHDPNLDFETSFGDGLQVWHPKMGPLHVQGYCDKNTVDDRRIYNVLKGEIKRRLGNKRFYWIKVYVSRQPDGHVITQCTLNNEPFFAAEERMQQYAGNWEMGNQFRGEKQYIILRQCDKTWKPSKYNLNDLKTVVFGAIELFEEWTTEEEYDLLFDKICRLTGDIDLAAELYYLIPEIYCKITLPEVHYSDEMILIRPDKTQSSVFLSQLRSYSLIKKLVQHKIQIAFDNDKYKKVLFVSATFKAINDALLHGSKMEDLIGSPIVVYVHEDYNPYR